MSDLAILAPRHRLRPRARIHGTSAGDSAERLNRCAWPQNLKAPRDLVAVETDEDRVELRRRLLAIIAKASGADRQCHLTAAVMADRARVHICPARCELTAMKLEGLIDRFKLANGRTATMILGTARS